MTLAIVIDDELSANNLDKNQVSGAPSMSMTITIDYDCDRVYVCLCIWL